MVKYPFTTEIKKNGGSTIITIPPQIAKHLKLETLIQFNVEIEQLK